MKRFVCTLFSLVLITCFSLRVSASESVTIDYEALFDQAAGIGHDDTEYISTIKAAYEENPTAFLDALAEMDEDTIYFVVLYWIDGIISLDELYALRSNVSEASNAAEYTFIISVLDENIGLIENIYIMEPYMQYEDPDAPFSVPLLRRFIDLNVDNNTLEYDEAFNQMLASAYEASPVIVAEILCAYSDQEVKSLAKCIAKDYKKYNRNVPSPDYDDQPEEIACIIRIIQSEIHNAVNTQPSNDEIIGNDSIRITDTHSVILVTAFVCLLALMMIVTVLKKRETY